MTTFDATIVAAIAVHGIAFGGLCLYIASIRNLTPAWFWVGTLFGLFGLLAILATPAKDQREKKTPGALKAALGFGALILLAGGFILAGSGNSETPTQDVSEDSAITQGIVSEQPVSDPAKRYSDEAWVTQLRGYDDGGLAGFSDSEVLDASRGVCSGAPNRVREYLASLREPEFPGLSIRLFDTASRQRYCS